jgi:hypothetical protein
MEDRDEWIGAAVMVVVAVAVINGYRDVAAL